MEKSLPETAAEEMIRFIIDNQYKENEKLPTELEFAQQLKVGRGTVREAVKILIARNIVEVRQGAGTFVSKQNGVPNDPFGFMFLKNKKKTAMDLMEIRCLIEPRIAMLAAQNATEQEAELLEKACNAVEEQIGKGERHDKEDIAFHELIAKCSRNDVMSQLIPIMNYSILVFIDMTNNTLLQETIEAHREIVKAVKQKNGAKAYDEMYLHLAAVRKRIEKRIEEEQKREEV